MSWVPSLPHLQWLWGAGEERREMGREVVLLSWSRARPAAAALWAQRRGTLAL